MIITLKGADFSQSNIGTLSTYSIRFNSNGITNTNTSVDRETNTGYTATITFKENYELNGAVTVTMGGVDITSTAVSGLNINIAKVTGNVVITVPAKSTATGDENVEEFTMLSERIYPDTNIDINATSQAGDDLEMVAKFIYAAPISEQCTKQLLCGSNMGVLMMIHPDTKTIGNNTTKGTYALTVDTEYYMKIKLTRVSANKSTMVSTIYSGTDNTLSNPLDSITRNITDTTPYPLYLGNSQISTASGLESSANNGIKVKEYWVYKPTGTLIFNGVPAKRNSDNAYGLYDSVTQSFFAEQKIVTTS